MPILSFPTGNGVKYRVIKKANEARAETEQGKAYCVTNCHYHEQSLLTRLSWYTKDHQAVLENQSCNVFNGF